MSSLSRVMSTWSSLLGVLCLSVGLFLVEFTTDYWLDDRRFLSLESGERSEV